METHLFPELKKEQAKWLVTGAAGFIGSHLVQYLLQHNQKVIAVDNLSTGKKSNIDAAISESGLTKRNNFKWFEGDIRDSKLCHKLCKNADFVLHQAALGSVPRSLANPRETNSNNISGFLSIIEAARDEGVKRFVYASSSSVYGDDLRLPKIVEQIGRPLSPYAVTKLANELYAFSFSNAFSLKTVGLRYFNVFGPRQDPEGPYAAVIPRWIDSFLLKKRPIIFGDGSTSRDFCYIDNVVQANIRAAIHPIGCNFSVFNVAVGESTSLNKILSILSEIFQQLFECSQTPKPLYKDFRKGDILHSLADINETNRMLNYQPTVRVEEGLKLTVKYQTSRSAI